MNVFYKLFLRAADFLFPGACALCGGSLIAPEEIRFSLCLKCGSSIAVESGSKCNLCGKPLISEFETCLPCRNGEQRSFERLWVLFPYIGKYRKLLVSYKFRKNTALADFFAEKIINLFSETVFPEITSAAQPSTASRLSELKDFVIVPVPPRQGKIKETGWDQVEYLFKRLQKLSKNLSADGIFRVKFLRLLKRRKSKTQKYLSRAERIENLKGRIYMNDASAVRENNSDSVFILIDDVITTGSTMDVCASVLKEAGAQKVYGICLYFD